MKHELDALGRPYKFHLFSGALIIVDFLTDLPGSRFTQRIVGGPCHGSAVNRLVVKDYYSTALPEELQGKSMMTMQREGLLYIDLMAGVQSHVQEAEIVGTRPDGKKLRFTELSIQPASDYLRAMATFTNLPVPGQA